MSPTVHKSSAATFGYKYLFPIAWIGIFAIFIAGSMASDDEQSKEWARGMLIIVPYGAFWILWLAIRLKSVVANTDGLVIRSRFGDQTIPYTQVDWVYEIAMLNPPMISLQHTDPRTLESKKMLILLPMETMRFSFLAERPMTNFIRERVMEAKPAYEKEAEPNRWMPMLVVMATSIPVIVVMTYFFDWPVPG